MFDRFKPSYRFLRSYLLLFKSWLQLKRQIRSHNPISDSIGTKRLLILPADVRSPFGSRGDQAMLLSTLAQYRKCHPGIRVSVITATPNDDSELREAGIEPILLWKGNVVENIISNCNRTFDFFVVTGADCMDGFYGPLGTVLYIALADLMASSGVETRVLGFSFNANPSKWILPAFRFLNPEVTLRLRDEISLERFRRFSSFRNVELVADAAFCLEPDTDYSEFSTISVWCQQQRNSGRKIVVVNYHPMFPHLADKTQLDKWCHEAANNWLAIIENTSVAVVLLPHDNRAGVNDNTCLSVIWEHLAAKYPDRVYWSRPVYKADQIKALAGLGDCVFCCRMHLAIASLGQGVPVMSYVYQGKFEGLWRHFSLPSRYCLDAATTNSETFISTFRQFHDELPKLREMISVRLPEVEALAQKNFARL